MSPDLHMMLGIQRADAAGFPVFANAIAELLKRKNYPYPFLTDIPPTDTKTKHTP